MYQNKIYRVTFLIKQLLEFRVIKKSDWEVFDMSPEMDNKTIMRDIAEIKRLMKDIYGYELVYNRNENHYELR
ncbi:hypothetical protein HL57_gp31 [Leuconostoc phage phiLNTR2]|uniref:Uncharacterized protein n=2 Tax=Unaquatrovirus LN34 TaxID=2170248 RepID=A0A219VHM1_9CAUD|nr:hypothetical protein HL52_gp30 [Leuconostoc phage LN34]YP_009044943.1 hypothetical protein HL57_gp31 [Leuconostoc phage phiLNTR2]AOT27950.1 hypothetical protein [Leuconostoc phage CHB]AOT27993.1 hypothetical protein [Leuconostoc phage CHA]AFY98440.1 hypothetical protein phiLN34_030 [Leuconostoc phage LN34]AFY98482.1 hypothetical protein phiLNTR2_031 [Leuconostoc phage phiLNTR2]